MKENRLPELSMITVEMEERCDQRDIFLMNWFPAHPEIWELPTIEQVVLVNKALEEAGLK